MVVLTCMVGIFCNDYWLRGPQHAIHGRRNIIREMKCLSTTIRNSEWYEIWEKWFHITCSKHPVVEAKSFRCIFLQQSSDKSKRNLYHNNTCLFLQLDRIDYIDQMIPVYSVKHRFFRKNLFINFRIVIPILHLPLLSYAPLNQLF
jgi:hypothetical protein